MTDFNGWEKIGTDPIGSGGQSEVWLARSPQRVKQRTEALRALERNGPIQPMAEAEYTLVRPENPSEVGALKIFKFRENSVKPIERLKREIAVLKDGRPNLPKLLDSNADQLWMVTEYFPNKTVAENRNLFTARPLDSLNKFRGLVETISKLHGDGIVHRDIKAANVFVAGDGRLIPGDFGLVYTDNADRLTRSKERIGPWEHLPRWANLPTRVENPTPAIDVYLLGSLLWVMVSGQEWFYGDMYKSSEFDLELRFPQDRSMRLINLVLSQCLGAQENLCVKNASELLTVVDEVLSTLTRNTPILDENNKIIIPCRFCPTGFYESMKAPTGELHDIVQLQGDHGGQRSFAVGIYQCPVCTNIQWFGIGEPQHSWTKQFQRLVR